MRMCSLTMHKNSLDQDYPIFQHLLAHLFLSQIMIGAVIRMFANVEQYYLSTGQGASLAFFFF